MLSHRHRKENEVDSTFSPLPERPPPKPSMSAVPKNCRKQYNQWFLSCSVSHPKSLLSSPSPARCPGLGEILREEIPCLAETPGPDFSVTANQRSESLSPASSTLVSWSPSSMATTDMGRANAHVSHMRVETLLEIDRRDKTCDG